MVIKFKYSRKMMEYNTSDEQVLFLYQTQVIKNNNCMISYGQEMIVDKPVQMTLF